MAILVTGAAGFVGYHVAEALLGRGEAVIGVDDLNAYYDVRLKQARLDRLVVHDRFSFQRLDLADRDILPALSAQLAGTETIIHLAAQAGVRHSMVDPHAYVAANVMGHLNMLELARRLPRLKHLLFASSSSVYGANARLPFAETDAVDTPLSLYAATKRADELMSHAYAHLFAIPQTGLRFFTVYGPWGRPDMAYFSFARAIMAREPITVYEGGELRRDFTYIDDIVAGILGVVDAPPPTARPGAPPLRLLNIGNTESERVRDLITHLEAGLGRSAIVRDAARPLADVSETCADVSAIAALTGFAARTPLAIGIPRFAAWFLDWQLAGAADDTCTML